MAQEALPLTRVVKRDEVPEDGLEVTFEPGETERADIAKFLSIPAVEALQARLLATRHGRGGLRVRGEVTGNVVQTCVVTLEPVSQSVSEAVDTIYAPEGSPVLNIELTPEELASEESDIEPMANGSIDLGGLVIEHLALGLDPYPRKPGVEFEPVQEGAEEASPFAKLARLRGDQAEE